MTPRTINRRETVVITVMENEVRSARIVRYLTDEDGTISVMKLDDGTVFDVLEPELNDNKSSISCIPTGMYRVVPHESPRFGSTYLVKGVANRSFILFHSGNTENDTEGCILVGMRRGEVNGKRAVLESKTAMEKLKSVFGYKEFWLTIVDSY